MSKSQKIILIILAVVIIAIQLVPVERTNPPVTADVQAPPDVKKILTRSCYDCHSNQTKWPWYSYVAPASWLVASDVKDGRRHLNFSEWGALSLPDQRKVLAEIWEEVDDGEMPLEIYTLIHSEALISASDLNILYKWTHPPADTLWP